MKNFHTNFYVLIELHELNQFKIRVIRLIVESLQSICVEIFQYEICKTDRIILNAISLCLESCIPILESLSYLYAAYESIRFYLYQERST